MTSFLPVSAVLPGGIYLDGTRADGRIDGRVLGAKLIRAYDEATSLELTLWDDDFEILSGGLLARRGQARPKQLDTAGWARFGAAQVPLDGIMFRLAGVSGSLGADGHTVTITFEDEVAALMRRHKGALKASRKEYTRAEFIGLMAREVKETRIHYRSPEQHIEQNVKKDHPVTRAEKERDKGLATAGLTIKGVKLTAEQRRNLETALAVCDHEQAGDRATMALLVAGIQESAWVNLTGGDADSSGVLQVRSSTAVTIHPPQPGVIDESSGLAHGGGGGFKVIEGPSAPSTLNPRDVAAVCRTFLRRGYWGKGGAIKLAADHPDWTVGEIAQNVQGSAFPTAYDPWAKEAQAILDAYGGVGQITVTTHRYVFRRQKGETSWAASARLADEVRWRRFADRNVLWYVSDDWLTSRAATFRIQAGEQARRIVIHDGIAHTLLSLDYTADVGKPVSEMQLQVMLGDRWAGSPGAAWQNTDLGPLNDRWLIARNELDLASGVNAITIRRPAPKLPEPAPTRETSVLTESTPEKGSPRQRIVAAGLKAYSLRSQYVYEQSRPMPDSLLPTGREIKRIDCSAFVTLVYKAAGVTDPNGLGYNGAGNTSTLRANGTKTNDPQPGDILHFGSGAPGNASHVNLYIGGGDVLNMGGAGLTKLKLADVKAWTQPLFAGCYSYDLTDQGL